MKNELRNTDELNAKKEPPITGGELLAEIKPLLDEYFLGEAVQEGEYLIYRMPNGQTWRLSAEEM